MTTNETINPAEIPRPNVEKADSLSINKIEGKTIHIVGYNHTKGKPTEYTNKDDIDDDGLTDYWTIKTDPAFDLKFKDEGVKPINSFFIKKAQANEIERIPNYESVNNGGRIGPVQAVKRNNPNTHRDYWTFAYENDDDFQ